MANKEVRRRRYVEEARVEIRARMGDLEDRLEALKKLQDWVDEITGEDHAEIILRRTGAWYYYNLTDFPRLMDLVDFMETGEPEEPIEFTHEAIEVAA